MAGSRRLVIDLLRNAAHREEVLAKAFPDRDFRLLSFQSSREIRNMWRSGKLAPDGGGRLDEVAILTYRIEVQQGPNALRFLALWLRPRRAFFLDGEARRIPISWGEFLFRTGPLLVYEFSTGWWFVRRVAARARAMRRAPKPPAVPLPDGRPLKIAYLRTDYFFGRKAGGSVGHVAGVVNGFASLGHEIRVMAADTVELVDPSRVPVTTVDPPPHHRDLREVPTFLYNGRFLAAAPRAFPERPDFVYQRLGNNNFVGLTLARRWKVPFVLEYNGSEVWIARNWDKAFKYQKFTEEIEDLNLAGADLIVTVSDALRRQLVERGVPGGRILLHPNGISPEDFADPPAPEEVRRLRASWGFPDDARVVGFLGTFGTWHGTLLLVEALAEVRRRCPSARFAWFGEGQLFQQTVRRAEELGLAAVSKFTGMVPQGTAPKCLAACDVLVNPTVPNPDGSEFFGSPTKLFEYMAAGKGIVASRIGQVADVLANSLAAGTDTPPEGPPPDGWENKLAVTCAPGDPATLAQGISFLCLRPEVCVRLGANARQEALAKYTWEKNVAAVIERLRQVCGK